MHFMIAADTDVGTRREVNQDSVLVKHGSWSGGEVLMAAICDGMGGLSQGEAASASVIRTFSRWFERELAYELEDPDLQVIGGKWSLMLKELNVKIMEYGRKREIELGTTFTGILMIDDKYVIVHVGDTRVYHLGKSLRQITQDQTFVAREVNKGTMTMEQAAVDKRRNMLLQCVGASESLEPEVLLGTVQRGAYLLCSDGFRHKVKEEEIFLKLNPSTLTDAQTMRSRIRYLIDLVKQREEKDNISAVLIRAV